MLGFNAAAHGADTFGNQFVSTVGKNLFTFEFSVFQSGRQAYSGTRRIDLFCKRLSLR